MEVGAGYSVKGLDHAFGNGECSGMVWAFGETGVRAVTGYAGADQGTLVRSGRGRWSGPGGMGCM